MKRILFYLLPLLFLIACNKGKEQKKTNLSPREAAVSKIDSLETHIRASADKQENPDVTLALNAIKHYRYFAADFPQDSLSPDYLYRAAQIYEGVLQDYAEAAEIYGSVYEMYPNYKNRPMMLFYQGNASIEAQDTASASLYLGKFMREYSNHPFASQAQGLLNIMRMSDAQLQDFLTKARKQPEGSAQNQ